MTESSSQFPVLSSQQQRAIRRWLKFNIVGGIGIGVQLAALAIFRSLLHFAYLLATVVAVESALLHNFVWHDNGLTSTLGNLLLMRWLVGGMHMNYFAANVIAIAACSLVNFLLSDCFVFQAEPRA